MFGEFGLDEFAGTRGADGDDERCAVGWRQLSVGDHGDTVNLGADFFW